MRKMALTPSATTPIVGPIGRETVRRSRTSFLVASGEFLHTYLLWRSEQNSLPGARLIEFVAASASGLRHDTVATSSLG